MRGWTRLASLLVMALGLAQPACRAATAEELARVQLKLQQVAAPWCERLAERGADGRKRCTIQIKTLSTEQARAFSFLGSVIVTQPMLAELSEPELALMAGHEFAHLVLGHPLAGASMGGVSGDLRTLVERTGVPPRDDAPKDRLQMELDADRLGLFFAGLAGYPVQQLAQDWPALIARLPVKPQTGDDTHPSVDARAALLLDAAKEFCTRGQRGEPLMPTLERLQPRYETDIDALREQQAHLPILTVCRRPTAR